MTLGPYQADKRTLGATDAGTIGIIGTQDGGPGDVLFSGVSIKAESGFSKAIIFRDSAWAQSSSMFASQVIIDRPPESLGLPEEIEFSGHLLLFNSSDQDQVVELGLSAGGRDYPLPRIFLSAAEARRISLDQLGQAGLIPTGVGDGKLTGSYSGEPGSVIGEVVSMSPDGNYLLATPLLSQQGFGFTLKAWRTDGEYNTLLSVNNVSDEATQAAVKTVVDGREFQVNIELAPGEQQTIDFRSVLAGGSFRDRQGDSIPQGIESGTFTVRNATVSADILVHYQVVNAELATCDPGVFEMVYCLYTEHDPDQPVPDGDFWIQTHAYMSDDTVEDVTLATAKTVGDSRFIWSQDGQVSVTSLTSIPEVDFSDLIDLIGCGGGSVNSFSAESFIALARQENAFTFQETSPVVKVCHYLRFCPTSTPTCPTPEPEVFAEISPVEPCEDWIDFYNFTFRLLGSSNKFCFPVGFSDAHRGNPHPCT